MLQATNPYQSFLADQNPQEVMAATPALITSMVQQIGPQGLERSYAPGKWTVHQVLCHLADCEIAFGFRLRQALAEPHHTIQPFDQDLWSQPYQGLDKQTAVPVFLAVRQWNLQLLGTLQPADYARIVTHPERGPMTFQTIVETMAGHDLNHLQQLKSLLPSESS